MKNKIMIRITTALFAALILMSGFSIPAYANGGGEATNDSNVKTEEKKEEKTPLTPDGNMSLVDNVKGDAAKDKEFIIVKSKGGNYFYIVIDHAAQGENTVHFLNQVDEKDLLSIIDEKSSLTEKPELPKQEETVKPEAEKLVRLGRRTADGRLRREAIRNGARVVEEMVRRSREMGAEPCLVGTMALRVAENAQDFLREILGRTGLEVRILSGEEEARLA